MTKKLLRKVSVFSFSFLVFLLLLVASGIVRVRGAEISPGMRIQDYRGSVEALTIDSLLRSSLVENILSNLPAAPDADVDLQAILADVPDPVLAGNVLNYNIDILNSSPVTATLVIVNETLPPEVMLLSAVPSQGSCANTMCDLGDLEGGAAATVTFTVQVDPSFSGTLDSQVEVSSSDNELNPGDNTDSEQTIVDVEADLEIVKSDDPDPVYPGDPLTYILEITNHGPSDAMNVLVNDDFLPALTFISSNPGSPTCRRIGTEVDCELGDLAAGASMQVTLLMSVKTDAPSMLVNSASITSDTLDPDQTNNGDSENTTVILSSDVSVTKVDDPDPVLPGGVLNYTLTVNNIGLTDAVTVVLTDTLPAEVTFVSASPDCFPAAGVVTCDLGTLAAGASANVSLVTQVDLNATGAITNIAQVSTPNDANPGNDIDSETTLIDVGVDLADLSISKSDLPDPVLQGELLTYTVVVTNDGPDSATNVIVTDTLPAEVTFVSASAGCLPAAGVVTCDLDTLAAGASATVIVETLVDADAAGTITNNAEVSSPDDPQPGNNVASEDTSVVDPTAEADLSITKTASPDTGIPGEYLTYTLEIVNIGPDLAASVFVTDTLPDQVTFVSTQPGPICSQSAGVVTCGPWDLGPSGTTAVNIIVEVDPTATGPLVNQAEVGSDVFDPDTSNNEDSISTSVEPSADLVVTTIDDPDPINPGELLAYTLTVINNGPFTTGGVTLIDTLPAEVTFLNATPSQGSCIGTTCSLGTIDAGESAQVNLVGLVAVDANGVITNTAQVFGSLLDPLPENDIDVEHTTVGLGADLSLAKTSSPNPVVAGGLLTYTLSIHNQGDSNAPSVTLIDTLPGNVTFLSSTPGTPTCAQSAEMVICDLGTIASGETRSVTILVRVNVTATDMLTNHAQVSSIMFDPDESNNNDTEETTVLASDSVLPTVEWVYPVGNEQSYNVGTEILPLEATASDNVAVERVDFFWWDPELGVNGEFVDIGSDFDAPYRVDFDTSVLYYGYNQVYVRAYDTSGNTSNRPRILLFRLELEHTLYLPAVAR